MPLLGREASMVLGWMVAHIQWLVVHTQEPVLKVLGSCNPKAVDRMNWQRGIHLLTLTVERKGYYCKLCLLKESRHEIICS